MLKTRVTEILGIEYPIIAGPMAYLSSPELVSAVSNAGGMGIIASLSYQTIDELRDAIRKTQQLTDKPFAVNVTLLPMSRQVNYEDYFGTALNEGVKIIETSGRSPEPYIKTVKDAGAIAMHRATRIRDIKTAERVGADIVTILGTEAAGHPGQEDVTSMVRIPIAADSVKVPLISAGGIADARGFIAALSLGAEGVLMGTRFMASKECNMHDNVKKWMLELTEADTMIIQRSIKNASRVVEKILEMENKGATLEELLPLLSGQRGVNTYETGDINGASIAVGQCVGLIREIPTVKEIIDSIITESEQIIQRLNSFGNKG